MIKRFKIKTDKIKRMVIFFFVSLFLLVILLNYLFLLPKVIASRTYQNNLNSQIKNFVSRIDAINRLNKEELDKELESLNRRFPKKEEIPTILDKLEQLGEELGVEITYMSQHRLGDVDSINVKVESKSYKFNYRFFTLTLNLTCSYIKFAEFLEALDNWCRCVVLVRSFDIDRDEVSFERLKVYHMIIEIPTVVDDNE